MSTPEPAAIPEQGPKYFVNLEGIVKPWDEPQITVSEIRELAGDIEPASIFA